MFYETAKNDHGLPHNPFKACISPRPIGWITSLDEEGRVNLAPYSFFNAVSESPPQIILGSSGVKFDEDNQDKDTVSNIEATGEFVCNMATWDLREAMVKTSAPLQHGDPENQMVDLELEPSQTVAPPRVAASPIHLECQLLQVIDLPATSISVRNALIIASVVGIHIADEVLVDGMVDLTKAKPLARLGYLNYSVIEKTFQMRRPPERA